jgi:hypothetical protein
MILDDKYYIAILSRRARVSRDLDLLTSLCLDTTPVSQTFTSPSVPNHESSSEVMTALLLVTSPHDIMDHVR